MSVNVKLGNDTINNVDSVRLRSADVEGEYCKFQEKIDVPYVEYVMDNSDNIISATIHNTNTIPNSIFSSNTTLKTINIDTSCTKTGVSSFAHSYIQTVNGFSQSNITYFGYSSFLDCQQLVLDTLPQNTRFIGQACFQSCFKVTFSVFPHTITRIAPYAFYGCTQVTFSSLPDNVNAVEVYVFGGCSGITTFDTNNASKIEDYAFYNCTGLLSVVLSANTSELRSSAFSNCTSLTSITCKATTPPTIQSSTFQSVPPDCAIYVPADSVSAYKAATNWSTRADYIQAIPS